MTNLSTEDAAIAREQGDLKRLLLMAAGVAPTEPKRVELPDPEPEVPLPRARPGAWPTGTSPPSPAASVSGPAIDAALEDYRQWYLAGRPKCDERCDCPSCTDQPEDPA